MPESHLRLYLQYGEEKGFPSRRMELYMAQLAATIVKSIGGGQNLTLKDFLLDPPEKVTVEDDVEALKLAIGFNPRNK